MGMVPPAQYDLLYLDRYYFYYDTGKLLCLGYEDCHQFPAFYLLLKPCGISPSGEF